MKMLPNGFLSICVAAVTTLVGGCSKGVAASAKAGVSSIATTHWMVVVDPTVGQAQPVNAVLDALGERVSARDALTVLFVRDKSIALPDTWTKFYTLNKKSKRWREEHLKALSIDIESIKKNFHDRRSEFLTPGTTTHARSCIVTSLSQVSRLIAKSQLKSTTHLIVASDFLEVCPEESDTNLERNLLNTQTVLPKGTAFSLGDVSRTAFLRVPSTQVATTAEQSHLEELWTRAAASLDVSGDRFWFGEQVSQLGEYFSKSLDQ